MESHFFHISTTQSLSLLRATTAIPANMDVTSRCLQIKECAVTVADTWKIEPQKQSKTIDETDEYSHLT